MEIRFKCECGQTLKVGEDAAGKTGKCPACGRQVRIPSIEEIHAQPLPVQIVSAPAEPSSDTALEEPPAAAIPKARPSAPAQPTSDTGLKEAPAESAMKKPFAPKGKSALDRLKARGTKPAAALRTRRGVRVRTRGAEEEEEEYEAPADKKKKQLIIAGAIVAVALIALLVWYFASYKPGVERQQRIDNYKEKALDFSGEVATFCAFYSQKDIPFGAGDITRKVNDLKYKFEEGVKPVTEDYPLMRTTYSYKDMEKVLNKLDEALGLVRDRAQVDQDREQTPEYKKEKVDSINSGFQAVIKECSALATNIEKAVKTLH